VRDIDAEFAEKSWSSRFGDSTEGPTAKATKGTRKNRGERSRGSEKSDASVPSFVTWWCRTVWVYTFAVGFLCASAANKYLCGRQGSPGEAIAGAMTCQWGEG